ncbi:MAG: RNA methyltransferase [Prevotellaceae bacterium]|jgi:tRNA G18 (ribose-2'-O)-methylase SpoU|nr:RNA methyltransferase [Prevotellaceae bacterium]
MRKLKTSEIQRLSIEEFKNSRKIPLVVVLDNVRSLHNVGSVFRTADAFLTEKILLCGITGAPPNAEIHKSALGAEFSVDWQYFENTVDAIEMLKSQKFTVISIEQAAGSIPLTAFKAERGTKYAVVFGNEVKGVQQQAVTMSDICLEVPQFGTKHSLNVSVAAGIVIWEMFNLLNHL